MSIVYARRLGQGQGIEQILAELVTAVGGLPALNSSSLVLLKPNYVAPFPKATTDFAVLDFFIQAVREAGGEPVVGEMSGYEFDTESTLHVLGVRSFLEARNVRFINFEQTAYVTLDPGAGLPRVEVAQIALEAEFIINLPVLKGHTITKVTGAAKNFFGLLSRNSRRRLHCHGLDKGIAALARAFPNALHFVDARYLLTRAVFGEPQALDCFLAGSDPFALDHVGSKLLGINPESVGHLAVASPYTVDGPCPGRETLSNKDTLRERLHRMMYACFYYLDECQGRLFKRTSLIPHLHWYLGVHPDVSAVPAVHLPEIARLCPVGAISIEQGKILKDRCLKVRCLRCYTQDPTGKVALKGLNAPKR